MLRAFVATVLAALCLSGLSARSDDIPTLDVNPVCHGIAMQGELDAGLQQTSFQQCVQSEQTTREQIKKEWSTFSAADKSIALPWLRQEESRVTPSSSPVWKWRAMSESCAATLTACPSRTYHPRRWVIASHDSVRAETSGRWTTQSSVHNSSRSLSLLLSTISEK